MAAIIMSSSADQHKPGVLAEVVPLRMRLQRNMHLKLFGYFAQHLVSVHIGAVVHRLVAFTETPHLVKDPATYSPTHFA